ncbi:MAG: Rieske (2Fe-2S) protein [Chloroflexota bacterium]|nr:Rieske (2Fe-2S) protein [Chloroflexota bacterium]
MSKITRHDFLKVMTRFLFIAGGIAIFGPIVSYFFPATLEETPSEPVPISPEDELLPNASKTVQFGRYPAIIINTDQGLRAYSAVCTHFACIVKWNPELYEIVCPCHEGYFDPYDGSVISGPPPTPLESLPVNIVDGQIFVGGEG